MRVADARSFSAAARQWRCSKAVISKYVAALEARLGVALLQRTTRSVRLTDAGRDYYRRCVDVLAEVDALDALVQERQVAASGVLRLSAPPGFLTRHLEGALSDFVALHPSIQLDVHLTHRMVDLVEEGFDLAIRVTAPRDSALVVRRLAPAPLVLVAAPAYLAAHGAPADPAELANRDCLVDTNFRDRGRWRFEGADGVATVDVKGPIAVNSPTVVCDLAVEGHGLAIVPDFVARPALDAGTLVEVDVGRPAFDWSIYAVHVRRRYIATRVRLFVDHLAAVLAA